MYKNKSFSIYYSIVILGIQEIFHNILLSSFLVINISICVTQSAILCVKGGTLIPFILELDSLQNGTSSQLKTYC